MSASAGYVHGYNRRAPALSVLIVQAPSDSMCETVGRYLDRCSFVMAALPHAAASAVRTLAFDGVVVPPTIDGAMRAAVLAGLPAAGGPRVIERDDPVSVARELRALAVARRSRASSIALRA